MTAYLPPVFVTGAEEKSPTKNRQINRVWIFSAAPAPKQNIPAIKYGGNTANRRPYTSDNGAHRRGPNPKLLLISLEAYTTEN
jgi:hypothetical protein